MSEEFSIHDYSPDELVVVFRSRNHDAESEAEAIHGLLESAGMKSLIVRENVPELPTGPVEVRVLESDEKEARELIESAEQSSSEEGSK